VKANKEEPDPKPASSSKEEEDTRSKGSIISPIKPTTDGRGISKV